MFLLSRSDERTWTTSDIVECEFGDTRVEFHQQGERLADASAGTENCDLGQLQTQTCQCIFRKVYWEDGEHSLPGSQTPRKLDAAQS
jgi:hypothetical protein